MARYLNDHIAQVCSENPTRFAGLGTLPMQAPDLAIAELRRCVQDLGLRGIQIATHVKHADGDWNLNHPKLFPIFEEAEKLGAAIFVHPWDIMGSESMPEYWLPWLVGMPAETARAICSMIFGGIFERLPNLKVCFAHGGGSFPQTIGRVVHGHHCRPDLCAVDNPKSPAEYIGKFYVDSLVHDESVLKFLVNQLGANRVMLGSDYPFPLGEVHPWASRPGEAIEKCEFDEKTLKWLYSDSALEWLGLEESQFRPAKQEQ